MLMTCEPGCLLQITARISMLLFTWNNEEEFIQTMLVQFRVFINMSELNVFSFNFNFTDISI